MSVPAFIGVCCGSFLLLYVIVKRANEYGNPKPLTVEQEQKASRDVVATIPQSCPGITVGDADVYCADDPIQSVMNFMQDNRAATGL